MRQTCLPAGRETNSSGLVLEYRVSLSADKAGLLRGSLFWSCEYPVSLSAEMKQVRKKPLAKRQAPSSPNQRKLALLRLVGRQA